MRETHEQPTEPGYYWARRDGDLEGEIIEVDKFSLKNGECWVMGEGERESLWAFFLFVGPITNEISVL